MLDLLTNVGSTLTGLAWDLTAAQFMYTRTPYLSLREGKGIGWVGFGNYMTRGGKTIGPGAWMAKGLRNDASYLGQIVPKSIRSGASTFLGGGNLTFGGMLGFDPALKVNMNDPTDIAWAKSYKPGHLGGETYYGNVAKGRFLRGVGTAASALVIANVIGNIAMPLAFSAGRGLAALGQIGQVAAGNIRTNQLDWGSRAASTLMMSHASTERQRAVQALQQAGMRGNSYVGREAQMYHM